MTFNGLPWFHVHIESIGAQLCNTGLMCTYIADAAIVCSSQTSLWKYNLEQYDSELLFGNMTKSHITDDLCTRHPCIFLSYKLFKLPPYKSVSESEFA